MVTVESRVNLDDSAKASRTLNDYVAVLRRRKWIVIQAVVLVPLLAFLLSLQQTKLYEASSEVLLSRQNLASTLTGTPDPFLGQDAERVAQTQAGLARVPEVARRAIAAAHVNGISPGELLASSDVSAQSNADLLLFSVTDSDPDVAARLATAYGRQFTLYRRELDTVSFEAARAEIASRIKRLRKSGLSRDSQLYGSLVEKEQQLETLQNLQTSNTFVVRVAEGASLVQPRTKRNLMFGILLGLVFGIGLAFLLEALDLRVRSAEEVESTLGLPLLGSLPRPPKELEAQDKLVMIAEPNRGHGEAVRRLRTNLEFVNLGRDAKTIMVTSSGPREGKSTTIANLAVSYARGGSRVTLVDLDMRKPYLQRFFHIEGPGLTDVVLGRSTLDDAIKRVPIRQPGAPPVTDGGVLAAGSLQVLPLGPTPPNPGEFVNTRAVSELLERIEEQSDIVLIDAPPLLLIGDALILTTKVDALFVVVRLNAIRHKTLVELKRVLSTCRCTKLGVVVTDDVVLPSPMATSTSRSTSARHAAHRPASPATACPSGRSAAGRRTGAVGEECLEGDSLGCFGSQAAGASSRQPASDASGRCGRSGPNRVALRLAATRRSHPRPTRQSRTGCGHSRRRNGRDAHRFSKRSSRNLHARVRNTPVVVRTPARGWPGARL